MTPLCTYTVTSVLYTYIGAGRFLQYLDDWEMYVNNLEGYTHPQKELMLLSRETRGGIKISQVCLYINSSYIYIYIYMNVLFYY